MKSVAAADLFQVVIIVVMIGVVLPIVLMGEMGGPVSAVKALAPLDGDWLGGMSVVFLISLFLIDIPIVLIDASLWQKTGAAKNSGHIRRAVIITGLAFIVWGTLSAAYGVLAKRLDPGLVEAGMSADAALPSLLFNYMPPVSGLLLRRWSRSSFRRLQPRCWWRVLPQGSSFSKSSNPRPLIKRRYW